MASDKEKYEDLEDILADMTKFTSHDDGTYNMRRTYAYRIQAALRRHDAKLIMDCMKMAIDQIAKIKEEK